MGFLLQLLGFAKRLREWASQAFRWALASSTHLLMIALAASLAWGFWQHHNAVKWAKVLASTEQGYRNAQAEAKRLQDASDLATAARYSALAKESEHEHQNAVAVVQSAADRYAMSHRVRSCPAAGGIASASPADLPGDPSPPVDASGSADWIAVAPEDYRKFTKAPLQAAERGNYLWSLIDAGLAVQGD